MEAQDVHDREVTLSTRCIFHWYLKDKMTIDELCASHTLFTFLYHCSYFYTTVYFITVYISFYTCLYLYLHISS